MSNGLMMGMSQLFGLGLSYTGTALCAIDPLHLLTVFMGLLISANIINIYIKEDLRITNFGSNVIASDDLIKDADSFGSDKESDDSIDKYK